MTNQTEDNQWVLLGKISGVFGVKGWLKVFSDTQPRENILTYSPWYLKHDGQWQAFEVLAGKAHGKGVIAQLEGCDDRDVAMSLMGCDIAIKREQLPQAASGEYYWSDLQGLTVVNLQGVELGTVSSLMETGANDVVIVKSSAKDKRERLIPFVMEDFIINVDLENGVMTVDWDEDF